MGKVFEHLKEQRKRRPLLLGLVDPANLSVQEQSTGIAQNYHDVFDCFLVGGSTSIWQTLMEQAVSKLRAVTSKPIIVFPGGLTNLTPQADAVLFMSLMNSFTPFYIVEQQFQAAPLIRQMGLEPISTAYLIIGAGGTVGYVGHARPIPLNKPEIAAAYALAAQYFGFKTVYLEAGSGAETPVPTAFISQVRKTVDTFLIVGGGICTPSQLRDTYAAGADAIVIGNSLENADMARPLLEAARTDMN